MIIRLRDLAPEGLHVEAPLQIGPLRSDADEAIRVEEAFLRGDVRRTSRGLEIRGRLTCRALVPCARCLVPFPMAVDRTLDLRYATVPPRGKDIEIPEEDMDVDFLESEDELDLLAVATEQVYLELPMKPLCRPDCRGLCVACGGDLNRGDCRCAAQPRQA